MSAFKQLADRFTALQLKERRLVMLASVFGIGLLSHSLFIEPMLLKAKTNQRLLGEQQQELHQLQVQLVELTKQTQDPDANLRREVDQVRQQISGIENELHAFDHLLVAPANMPRLLQSLLSKHKGLELVRLKTLPASPLLQASATAPQPPTTQARPAQATGAAGATAPPPGGIYRHTIEITVAGSYADLLAYADELQRITPRPLWSAMQLKVVEYPRSELTFTLYTLSLDLPWLAV